MATTEELEWEYSEPHRSAPTPQVAFEETEVTLSGVRFCHRDYCDWCRHYLYGFTEGGTVRIGLKHSASRKTVRWYETEHPGKQRPQVPAVCPWCGHDQPRSARYAFTQPIARELPPYSPAGGVCAQARQAAFDYLRENYPDLAATADKAAGIG
jgi:hypothetical protein